MARPLSFLGAALISVICNAQNIGINTDGASPHPSAILDIDVSAMLASKAGLLLPRMTTAERNTIAAPATSLLIFNTTTAQFEYFDGTAWRGLLSTATAGWGLTGNAGTNPAANFLGTTDAQPLRLRVSNTFAGLVSNTATGVLSLGLNAGALSTGVSNTFIGTNAGAANTTGGNNTFVGNGAGAANTTLGSNVYVGHEAGNANATGQENVYIGRRAGANGTSGSTNVLIGNGAGIQNTANNNVMIGGFAGNGNTIGGGNTFVGTQAGQSTGTGGQNTFIGLGAGSANTTGQQITLVGQGANVGSANLTNASAFGRSSRVDADNSLVLGSVDGVNGATTTVNVGIGINAPLDRLHVVGSIRMVDGNQAVGRVPVSNANGTMTWTDPLTVASNLAWTLTGNAGTNPTTNFLGTTDVQPVRFRTNNVIAGQIPASTAGLVSFGIAAGGASTGTNNTVVGNLAGDALTTGVSNTLLGHSAGSAISSTGLNVMLGTSAGGNSTGGNNNVFVGAFSGLVNNADNNTMVGLNSGISNFAGTQNAFFGAGSGAANFSGTHNTFIGAVAGVDNTTGSQHTFVGWNAGGNTTNSARLTALGYETQFTAATISNSTVIGANASASASNSLILGGITGINGGTDVNVGIGTTAPARSLHISRGASGGTSSANSKLLLEDDAATYQHFLTPSTTESGLLFGTNLGSIRAGIIFNSSITDGFDFRTGGNTVRAVLTSAGDLGVGTTTPDEHAEIEGTGDQYLRVTSTNAVVAGVEFKRSGSGFSDWQVRNDGGLLLFGQSADELATVTDVLRLGGGSVTPATDNAIACGQAALRWTNVFAVNGTINTSDAREKQDVRALNYGLAEVMQLKPVRFRWKRDPEQGDKLGLLAQDLQDVLPETVVDKSWRVNDDGTREEVPAERLGVYYSDIIPVLIKAVQEQQQQIDQLREELARTRR